MNGTSDLTVDPPRDVGCPERGQSTDLGALEALRMDALNSMTASVAHEFNNLMTVVLVNLERLETEGDAQRRARQIQRATWGAQQAARLTGQMLSFARRPSPNNEHVSVDVNKVLSNFDAILEQMAGPGLKIRLALSTETLLASLDRSRLEMALLNLVKNAADACAAGGEVLIATCARHSSASGIETWVEIAVTDTGSGMSPEIAGQALQPFFTTKEPGKGTGLGLALVNDFTERFAGKLELETASGEGTTVRMLFPAGAT